MLCQAPQAVVLVRPHHFGPNEQTSLDNSFQAWDLPRPVAQIAEEAYAASSRLANALDRVGIDVHIFEDVTTEQPDSVFPNNWFSTHANGRVALYPMLAENRRRERRTDIVDFLKQHYRVSEIIDFSALEHDGIYLEGTGSIVFDHDAHIAYMAKSRRASVAALQRICRLLEYEGLPFDALDRNRLPIYHTNVMMTIARGFALVGFEAVVDADQRELIRDHLLESGKTVIDLSLDQLANFAGNSMELANRAGDRYLAMSTRAVASLSRQQTRVIEQHCEVLPVDVGPIELAGGSVRCMMAGIHLERRTTATIPTSRGQTGDVIELQQAV